MNDDTIDRTDEAPDTFGAELIQSLNEAVAVAKGEAEPARIYVPPTVDVAAIRKRMGMTQAAFASRFGLSVHTLRDWEHGRRVPEGPTRLFLRVIEREPEAVERALATA